MIRKGCLMFLILTGCATAQPVPDALLTLHIGASVTLAPTVGLTLAGVEDSRCPPKVMCVRQGGIAYRFQLHTRDGAEGFTLSAEAPAHASARLPGVRIALAEPAAATTDHVTIQISHP